jgi:hypothetical protein
MGASNFQGLAIPKPEPRWKAKAKQAADNTRLLKLCYADVDRRDGHGCRVCHKRVGGIGMLYAAHHHHLVYRSKGGAHERANVVTLCVRCHQAVHDGEIRLTGDADARDPVGVLCGVKLERAADSGWIVEGWR